MSWKIKEKLQRRLEAEQGAIVKEWGGRRTVVLVYPNTYAIGMGNLAVHSIYRMLNSHPDIACERAFLPDGVVSGEHSRTGTPVLSVESQRPLHEFDVVAFTASFENDFLNIIPILEMSKIPHRRETRGGDMPVLIAGGASLTLNPRPVERIFDAVFQGDAEAFEEDVVAALTSVGGRNSLIESLVRACSGGKRVAMRLDGFDTETVVHAAEASFGDMHLVEVQRGCPHRCGFCATPPLYDPPRKRSFESVERMVTRGLEFRRKFGLIGADILFHPDFERIAESISSKGASFSLSSVRADAIDADRAKLLAESGNRSIALGIEAGNERLRRSIGKRISDDEIISAAMHLTNAGVAALRLYFMIGLPGETDGDLRSIAELAERILKEARPKAALGLTITPFVPKPGTVLGSAEFAGINELKRKMRLIKRAVDNGLPIQAKFDSQLDAAIEALLANGSADLISFLEDASATSPKAAFIKWKRENSSTPSEG